MIPKKLDNHPPHPHQRTDNDDNFIMTNQDGSAIQPATPTKSPETLKREHSFPRPLFSLKDTMDAIPRSFPKDLLDKEDLMDVEIELSMKKPLFPLTRNENADTHATNAALDEAWPVMPATSNGEGYDQGARMDTDTNPEENYLPMTRAFSMMTALSPIEEDSSDGLNFEKTKLDTIAEEDNEEIDTSDRRLQETSPIECFAAPVNSPTDSALGAPMTVLNSSTLQMSTYQLNQTDSYHTTPSETAPPSYQTSPYLLPNFSQEALQPVQQASLSDENTEASPTLPENTTSVTLTQGCFVSKEEEKVMMTSLPPNPRPWGNKPTTFLCLPTHLRQEILYTTVSIRDFQIVRLRVIDVDRNYTPPSPKWAWVPGYGYVKVEESRATAVAEDCYHAFIFDDKVKAWDKVVQEVDGKLKGDLKQVKKQWRRLGLRARSEKIDKMGWREMEGSGWNGKF